MKSHLTTAALLGAVVFFGSTCVARADLMIHPVSGNPTGTFLAEAGAGVPPGTPGYVDASVDTVPALTYLFTYLGHGDSALANSFTVMDPNGTSLTFCTQPGMAACGGGPATAIGTTVALSFSADTIIPFSFTSPSGTVTHDSTFNASGVNYLASIPGTTNNLGPGSPAFLGFSDRPFNTPDIDYQDLAVRIAQVPEPGSLSLLALGLIGVAFYVQRRKRLSA